MASRQTPPPASAWSTNLQSHLTGLWTPMRSALQHLSPLATSYGLVVLSSVSVFLILLWRLSCYIYLMQCVFDQNVEIHYAHVDCLVHNFDPGWNNSTSTSCFHKKLSPGLYGSQKMNPQGPWGFLDLSSCATKRLTFLMLSVLTTIEWISINCSADIQDVWRGALRSIKEP